MAYFMMDFMNIHHEMNFISRPSCMNFEPRMLKIHQISTKLGLNRPNLVKMRIFFDDDASSNHIFWAQFENKLPHLP